MVKTFRKLAALTAAVALVGSFAVCASAAVTVNTTTVYDGEDIVVNTVVSADAGELNGAQVTYYATNENATATGGIVYMDQKPATNGSATFEFKTDAAYIGSGFKVSYTGATEAIDDYTIPVATEFCNITVTGPNGSASAKFEKGTDPDGTYTVAYTPTAGKGVSALQVTGGTVTIVTANDTSLTFTLSDFEVTTTDIAITATESYKATGNEIGSVINAGSIIAGEDSNAEIVDGDDAAYEEFKASAGDRKLTVIGKVTGLATDEIYGVIVAESITAGDVETLPTERVYAAKGKNDDGYFAVQLIDTNDDVENADFIKPGVTYQTAVYYKAGNVYKIVKGNDVTIPEVQ